MNIKSVTASCEHCGHRSEVSLARVLEDGQFTCATCGKVSRYDAGKIDAAAKKVTERVEKIKRKLGSR